MKITWFGHSAFRVEIGKSVLLIDPYLSANPVFKGKVADAAQGVTHVALTHGHSDHTGDAAQICKDSGAVLIAVYELAIHLNGKGAPNIEPGNTGGTIYTGDFDITFVRADHSSSSDDFVYLGNPCGLVVRAKPDGRTLYHMGDTDIFGDMALIAELHRPDIGIVPIGDRFTMNGRTAAIACRRYFNFSVVLPCHYRTFPLLAQSADSFVQSMAEDGGKVKVLDFGDSIEV